METINKFLSALNLKDYKYNNFELTESGDDFIDYYNFKIKNNKLIKQKVDKFNESINIRKEQYAENKRQY